MPHGACAYAICFGVQLSDSTDVHVQIVFTLKLHLQLKKTYQFWGNEKVVNNQILSTIWTRESVSQLKARNVKTQMYMFISTRDFSKKNSPKAQLSIFSLPFTRSSGIWIISIKSFTRTYSVGSSKNLRSISFDLVDSKWQHRSLPVRRSPLHSLYMQKCAYAKLSFSIEWANQ